MRQGIIALFLLLCIGACLALYPVWVLSFSRADRIIFLKVIQPGDTFQLGYLHSIARSDVWDSFLVDSEYRIVLTETRFKEQGMGLPFNTEQGEQLHREGEWFRLTGRQQIVPSIIWRVQSQWRNRFRFGTDSEADFSARIGDALIHIQVKKVRFIDWLGFYLRGTILTAWTRRG